MCVFAPSQQLHRQLGAKKISLQELDILEVDVAMAISLMEKSFPPSFFVIQTHLVSHLAAEIQMHGPWSARTLYPWEQFMGRLKQHVKNRAQAEARMAEGHLLRKQVLPGCSTSRPGRAVMSRNGIEKECLGFEGSWDEV